MWSLGVTISQVVISLGEKFDLDFLQIAGTAG